VKNRSYGRKSGQIPFTLILVGAWSLVLARDIVIVDGGPTGFATVADAAAALRSRGLLELPSGKGSVFLEAGGKTTWTFTGEKEAAYPAFAKFVWTSSKDRVQVAISILCEAAPKPCEKFANDMKSSIDTILKGEPGAN
jgi:hypothetical protein